MDDASPAGAPAIPPLESITAPLLLGGMFNWGLWGILACQTYVYRMYFPKDRATFKILIYGVFLIETLQTALYTSDLYIWFARGFADPLGLQKTLLSPFDTPMMGAIIALIVQVFYVYRIWSLNSSWLWYCVIILLLTVLQTIGSFIGGIRGLIAGVFSQAPDSTKYVYMWLVGEAVADVLIAAAMGYLLLKTRSNDMRASSDLLSRVVILIIESNALTATLAVLSLIMFVVFPNTNYFTCPTLVLGKIYANTLLVSFNNRIVLRNLAPTEINSSSRGNTFNSSRVSMPSRIKFRPGQGPGDTFTTDDTLTFTAYPMDATSSYKRDSTTVDHSYIRA